MSSIMDMESATTNAPSPNEIPPRTSSAGLPVPKKPSRSVLHPLSENSWLAAGNKSNTHAKMASKPLETSRATSDPNDAAGSGGSIGSDLIFTNKTAPRTWSSEKERILFSPYDYLEQIPGKDIRSQLIAAFNAWLKVPDESLKIITKVIGMLHTASLLVDDVEDSSILRRGVPVAHSIFGTAQTINSANYVYFVALQELQALKNPQAINIYTEELINLHRGQGMDLFWRDTLSCPSEDDYLEMVNNKTGGLFRLAVKLMQAESNCDLDCVPLVNTVGLLFQILDDYKNLSSTTYTINKGLAEDLTEGKFSFPIIHAIRAHQSHALVLTNILKQKTTDLEVKKYAINYLEKAGSFEYTRRVLQELRERAFQLIEEMDSNGREGDSPSTGLGTGIKLFIERLKVSDDQ